MQILHPLTTSAVLVGLLSTKLAAASAIAAPGKDYASTLSPINPDKSTASPPIAETEPTSGCSAPEEVFETLPYEFSLEVVVLVGYDPTQFRELNPVRLETYTPYAGVFFERPIITSPDRVRDIFQFKDKRLLDRDNYPASLLPDVYSSKFTFPELNALLFQPIASLDPYPTPLNLKVVKGCSSNFDYQLRLENGSEGELFVFYLFIYLDRSPLFSLFLVFNYLQMNILTWFFSTESDNIDFAVYEQDRGFEIFVRSPNSKSKLATKNVSSVRPFFFLMVPRMQYLSK